jgi:Zn-dependent protease with chaperone function
VREYGLRRRRALTLGLPLWHILEPQERVVVLGHEFAHYANGDTRRGLVVGTALSTLGTWFYVLRPGSPRGRSMIQTFANWLITVPWLVVVGLLALLDRLTLRASQRAEYRADALAARVGSGAAAVAAFDRLLLLDSVSQELRRQAILARTRNRGSDPKAVQAGLWARLAAHARDVTEHEHERLRRVSALRGHSTDSTHPPTHLRCALLAGARDEPAAVVLTAEDAAAIDAELAVVGQRVAGLTLRDIHL